MKNIIVQKYDEYLMFIEEKWCDLGVDGQRTHSYHGFFYTQFLFETMIFRNLNEFSCFTQMYDDITQLKTWQMMFVSD